MDVAKAAGVSHQTVSRVINGSGPVSASTRARVEAAVAELGYTPLMAAQALARGRPDTFGVLSIGTHQFGPRRMLTEIETTARRRGYEVAVVDVPEADRSVVADAIDSLAGNVAGMVVLSPIDLPAVALDQMRSRVPVVLVDATSASALPYTTIDQDAGARLGVEHLLSLGHRRIALIGGPAPWHDATQRMEGWVAALAEQFLEPAGCAPGDWSAQSGATAVRALLDDGVFRGPVAATAVLCANDSMAIGVLHELHAEGVSVPGEVSVVGFDDVPEAAFLVPSLTTIRQDFTALAQGCIAQLLDLVEHGGRTGFAQVIEPSLIVRASSGPAPTAPG